MLQRFWTALQRAYLTYRISDTQREAQACMRRYQSATAEVHALYERRARLETPARTTTLTPPVLLNPRAARALRQRRT
jgi:hypothetical protein